jgi:hypothetical protein
MGFWKESLPVPIIRLASPNPVQILPPRTTKKLRRCAGTMVAAPRSHRNLIFLMDNPSVRLVISDECCGVENKFDRVHLN